jgi:purine-binding chemotaxis protein CheW
MIGYITFRLGDRELVCRLDEVREVVRLSGLDVLPGMTAPMSGLLELRGNPLPVVDLRTGDAETLATARGDVLVLATGADAMGVVVDQVTAVHHEADLEPTGEDRPNGLPHYVVEVLRRPGTTSPLLLVDLRRLLGVVAGDRQVSA